MTFNEFMQLPLGEALTLFVQGAVDRYLDQSGLLAAMAKVLQQEKQKESESLNFKGALACLNDNGYPMKKGQLYKLTSDPNSGIPFQKFGSRLHFYKSQLIAWAESRLISGNAVGYLPPAETKRKGGLR